MTELDNVYRSIIPYQEVKDEVDELKNYAVKQQYEYLNGLFDEVNLLKKALGQQPVTPYSHFQYPSNINIYEYIERKTKELISEKENMMRGGKIILKSKEKKSGAFYCYGKPVCYLPDIEGEYSDISDLIKDVADKLVKFKEQDMVFDFPSCEDVTIKDMEYNDEYYSINELILHNYNITVD